MIVNGVQMSFLDPINFHCMDKKKVQNILILTSILCFNVELNIDLAFKL